jgi:hypothetical protein
MVRRSTRLDMDRAHRCPPAVRHRCWPGMVFDLLLPQKERFALSLRVGRNFPPGSLGHVRPPSTDLQTTWQTHIFIDRSKVRPQSNQWGTKPAIGITCP